MIERWRLDMRMMSTASEPAADMPETESNWAELPMDVMALIFEKAGSMVVLLSAQAVCSSWWKLAQDTRIWRIVRFTSPYDLYVRWSCDLDKMAIDAIDRSQGQLVEFSVEHLYRPHSVIKHLAQRTNILRHLRLKYCFMTICERMIESFQCFTLLEELELSYNSFSEGVLEAVGCPQIRSLDLRKCYNVKLEGSFLKKSVERIKDLRLPEDLLDDYDYEYSCTESSHFAYEDYDLDNLEDYDWDNLDDYDFGDFDYDPHRRSIESD